MMRMKGERYELAEDPEKTLLTLNDSIELLQCSWLCSLVSRQRQVRSDSRWGGQGLRTRRSHLGRQCRSKAHELSSWKDALIASRTPRRAARKMDERGERKRGKS